MRTAIAVVAAYAFALHAIVLGMALGAAPAPGAVEALHALCAPDEAGPDLPGKVPAHLHADACCTANAPAAPLPGAPLVVRPASIAAAVDLTATAPEADLARQPVVPLGSRAPPRLV